MIQRITTKDSPDHSTILCITFKIRQRLDKTDQILKVISLPDEWSVIDPGHRVGDPNFYLPQPTSQSAEVCHSSRDPDNTFAAERNHMTQLTRV